MRVASSKDTAKKEVTETREIAADSEWRDIVESTYENIFRLRALHNLMRAAEGCNAAKTARKSA